MAVYRWHSLATVKSGRDQRTRRAAREPGPRNPTLVLLCRSQSAPPECKWFVLSITKSGPNKTSGMMAGQAKPALVLLRALRPVVTPKCSSPATARSTPRRALELAAGTKKQRQEPALKLPLARRACKWSKQRMVKSGPSRTTSTTAVGQAKPAQVRLPRSPLVVIYRCWLLSTASYMPETVLVLMSGSRKQTRTSGRSQWSARMVSKFCEPTTVEYGQRPQLAMATGRARLRQGRRVQLLRPDSGFLVVRAMPTRIGQAA